MFILQDRKSAGFPAKHWQLLLRYPQHSGFEELKKTCGNKIFVINKTTSAVLERFHGSTCGIHFNLCMWIRKTAGLRPGCRVSLYLQWGDWLEGGRWRARLCPQWPLRSWPWFWRGRRWWQGRGAWCRWCHTSCLSSANTRQAVRKN